MQSLDNNTEAFLALVRAGLWETEAQLFPFGEVDYSKVIRLAEEQTVVGLVLAGLEHVTDSIVPKEDTLQLIHQTLQIEQRNKEVNEFISHLAKRFNCAQIFALLVKGQGVAQYYEKPLWRSPGDVDLLLNNDNYEKAKDFLSPLANDVQEENKLTKHLPMRLMGIDVELHGKMPFAVSNKAQIVNDKVVSRSLNSSGYKALVFNGAEVYLPNDGNHIFLVFTHYLQHFFIEGVGLRQICDWCRMLWHLKSEVDLQQLESYIDEAGLMSEWKVFAALAVNHLGMPKNSMPFYDSRFNDKGTRVLRRVIKSGNFGHNNDLSYRTRYKGIIYKLVAGWRRFWDFASLIPVFPLDAPRFFMGYMLGKVK